MAKTLVVALGGNAMIKPGQKGTAQQHLKNLSPVAEQIANLYNRNWKIVITHGNGPQVGNILIQQEKARDYAPQLPLHVCVAESQGMIGSLIQEALYNHLKRRGFKIPVVTLLTQVMVDRADPAFRHPSKPIGPFYTTRQGIPRAWTLAKTLKGFRRLVPSPRPKEIIESREIRRVAREAIVIACGGGGIPVVRERGLRGIDAVIDKDLTAVKLADGVNAHTLAILTDVDFVYLNYRKPSQKRIETATPEQFRTWQHRGQFPPGSMGPKISAALHFLSRRGRRVIITRMEKLEAAMDGEWGTVIDSVRKGHRNAEQ